MKNGRKRLEAGVGRIVEAACGSGDPGEVWDAICTPAGYGRVAGLGPAFGTKIAAFAAPAGSRHAPLIADDLVRRAVEAVALPDPRTRDGYIAYVTGARGAKEPERLEAALFVWGRQLRDAEKAARRLGRRPPTSAAPAGVT